MTALIILLIYYIGGIVAYYYTLYDLGELCPIDEEDDVFAFKLAFLSWIMVIFLFISRIQYPNPKR